MLVKGVVLYSYRRVPNMYGNVLQRDGGAAHGAMHVPEKDVARAVIYFCGLRDAAVLKVVYGGNRNDCRPCDEDAAPKYGGSNNADYKKSQKIARAALNMTEHGHNVVIVPPESML